MSAEFMNNIIYIFSKSAMLFELNSKSVSESFGAIPFQFVNVEFTKKDQELNY